MKDLDNPINNELNNQKKNNFYDHYSKKINNRNLDVSLEENNSKNLSEKKKDKRNTTNLNNCSHELNKNSMKKSMNVSMQIDGTSSSVDNQSQEKIVSEKFIHWSFISLIRYLVNFNGNLDPPLVNSIFLNEFRSILLSQVTSRLPQREYLKFEDMTISEVISYSSVQRKPLFIYLHSKLHPNSEKFCSEILDKPEIVNMINTNFIAWGGCVEYQPAYRLSILLKTSSYPCVFILDTLSKNSKRSYGKVLDYVEGTESFNCFLKRLKVAAQLYILITTKRSAIQAKDKEREKIREEQDKALIQSIADDRKRAQEQQKHKEELKKKETLIEEEQKLFLKNKVKCLVPEPADSIVDKISIRIKVSNGQVFQRKFSSDHTLQDLRNYVDIKLNEDHFITLNYNMVLNFPKKIFSPNMNHHVPLGTLGLFPQCILFIQNNED